MNSYVEVTVILGTILNGSVWLTSAWLCRRPVRLRRILMLCPLAPLAACLCWFDGAVWVCALIELISALTVFSFGLQAAAFAWGLRFLLEFGLMKLWQGSLVHFQLFLPASCWQWTIAAGILLMWDFILQRKLGQGLAETAFLYPVTLQAGDCELALSGYLDSGNSAVIEGRPLIFCTREIKGRLNWDPVQPLPVETVAGVRDVSAISASLQIQGGCVQPVWLAFSEALDGCGYDTLLNVTLFTGHR